MNHGKFKMWLPSSMARVIERNEPVAATSLAVPSELRQWQVQLHLVPPKAPYFKEAELLVCADCVAFPIGNMHAELLKGKALTTQMQRKERPV